IIAGKRRHITALKREPFFRALRCDKLVLTALQTTVDLYLAGKSSELPVLAMLDITNDELQVRAEALLSQIRDLPLRSSIGEGKAQVGGGSLPRAVIPSVALDLLPDNVSVEDFAATLRRGSPPIIGYVAGGKFKLELRMPDALLSVGIVDVPGHEDFVKNMVAGVGSIDLALLVVAADDGWMPQTEEHLQILIYLGVRQMVVALTKIDLVESVDAA